MPMTLRAGQRITALRTIDYMPYACILAGETGIIIALGWVLGEYSVEIMWDEFHKGLALWGNGTLLVSPELDAIIPATVAATIATLQPLRAVAV